MVGPRVLALTAVATLIWVTGTDRRIPLEPANGTLGQDFVGVDHLRELDDGRILFAEAGFKNGLAVADFAANTVRQVGRQGDGPEEYRSVPHLFPLAGDTTLLTSPRERRIQILVGDRIVKLYPPDWPGFGKLASSRWALGASAAGKMLTMQRVAEEAEWETYRLELVDLVSGRADSVGTMRLFGGGDRRAAFVDRGEWAVLTRDGWIAALRTTPYRVDWRRPDGKWFLGKPIPVEPVPVNDREKAFYYERHGWRRVEKKTIWPKTVPPLGPRAGAEARPIATLNGKVIVLRNPTADHPGQRYDVIDRSGNLEGYLYLPANEQIMGFGKHSVYVAVKDENDVVRVRRHPWR